jgi:TatD DNase family protein
VSLQLVDTHAHLCSEAFADDLEQVVRAAHDAGVKWMLNVADDLASSEAVTALAAKVPTLKATAGVHPHAAVGWGTAVEQRLRELLASPEVVAVGEIGLDYHYDFSPREMQKEAMRAQLQLARDHELPVVVHNREADADILAQLSAFAPLSGVMHCFWSSLDVAQQALDFGLFLGVGGPITFGNAHELRAVLKTISLEHILLETDAPYLAPTPFRGRRNEPAFVPKVAEALAQLHGKSPRYVAAQTSENAERLFLKK